MGKEWKQWQILFWGVSKITADGDCSHEIKRHLLHGKKAMINLDSILKSRDITLPTKVCLVKAMVFPVVIYGCESWTIEKAEHPKNWCFWTVVLEKTLESSLDCKEIQLVHPKGNKSWIFIGRTDAEVKLQYFGHLMQRTDSLKNTLMMGKIEGKRRRGQQNVRLVGWHHQLDRRKLERTPGVGDGQGGLACCDSWGRKESNTTEWLNYAINKTKEKIFSSILKKENLTLYSKGHMGKP